MEAIKEYIINFLSNIDWSTITASGFLIWIAIKFFSKSFIGKLGEQTAELLTIKQKTQIEKSVEAGFNKALAEYQIELDKKKIAFEANYTFYNTERSKASLELYLKLHDFYLKAFNYVSGLHTNTSFGEGSTFETRQSEFEQSSDKLDDCYIRYKIFLEDDVRILINNFHLKSATIIQYTIKGRFMSR